MWQAQAAFAGINLRSSANSQGNNEETEDEPVHFFFGPDEAKLEQINAEFQQDSAKQKTNFLPGNRRKVRFNDKESINTPSSTLTKAEDELKSIWPDRRRRKSPKSVIESFLSADSETSSLPAQQKSASDKGRHGHQRRNGPASNYIPSSSGGRERAE